MPETRSSARRLHPQAQAPQAQTPQQNPKGNPDILKKKGESHKNAVGELSVSDCASINRALEKFRIDNGWTEQDILQRVWTNKSWHRDHDNFVKEVYHAVPNCRYNRVTKYLQRSWLRIENRAWEQEDNFQLLALVKKLGDNQWAAVGTAMNRMGADCRDQYHNIYHTTFEYSTVVDEFIQNYRDDSICSLEQALAFIRRPDRKSEFWKGLITSVPKPARRNIRKYLSSKYRLNDQPPNAHDVETDAQIPTSKQKEHVLENENYLSGDDSEGDKDSSGDYEEHEDANRVFSAEENLTTSFTFNNPQTSGEQTCSVSQAGGQATEELVLKKKSDAKEAAGGSFAGPRNPKKRKREKEGAGLMVTVDNEDLSRAQRKEERRAARKARKAKDTDVDGTRAEKRKNDKKGKKSQTISPVMLPETTASEFASLRFLSDVPETADRLSSVIICHAANLLRLSRDMELGEGKTQNEQRALVEAIEKLAREFPEADSAAFGSQKLPGTFTGAGTREKWEISYRRKVNS